MPGRNQQGDYRYAYQGQEKDPETGWEAFELRMYDGRVGRWMTTDPYNEFFSPYLAMGNNPINKIDPDGGHTDDWYQNALGEVIWQEGSAATVDINGVSYKNIGTTYAEVVDDYLMILGNGRSDLLEVYSLKDIKMQGAILNKYYSSNPKFMFGEQPDFLKINGAAVGIEFNVSLNSTPFLTGSKVAGLGIIVRDNGEVEMDLFGYCGGEKGITTSLLSAGAGGRVFWGFSRKSTENSVESFGGGYDFYLLQIDKITIQVGISPSWTVFSVGAQGEISATKIPTFTVGSGNITVKKLLTIQ